MYAFGVVMCFRMNMTGLQLSHTVAMQKPNTKHVMKKNAGKLSFRKEKIPWPAMQDGQAEEQ